MLDVVNEAVRSNISRVVAFVVTPVLLPLAGGAAYWLQNTLGIDMNAEAVTAYVVSVVAGVGLVLFKWISNRGEWEKAVVVADTVHDVGTGELPVPDVEDVLDTPRRKV